MKFHIEHQSSYSRGELLLRTFFGIFYIMLPHAIALMVMGIVGMFMRLIAFWVILFTGKYPRNFFDFNVGLLRWNLRVNARFYNLCDGYPAFGVNGEDDKVTLEVPYPEKLSIGDLLLKSLLPIILVPHIFVLIFMSIGVAVVNSIAFWMILITGKYPESLHNFVVGVFRWQTRLSIYMSMMSDKYPPYSGQPTEAELALNTATGSLTNDNAYVAEEIAKLDQLFTNGTITFEEFEKRKQQLLNG